MAFDPSSADETTAQACVEAAKQAEAAMGKALQHLGPAATLAAVPLDLQVRPSGVGVELHAALHGMRPGVLRSGRNPRDTLCRCCG